MATVPRNPLHCHHFVSLLANDPASPLCTEIDEAIGAGAGERPLDLRLNGTTRDGLSEPADWLRSILPGDSVPLCRVILRSVLLEQFWQPCKIDRHLSRLVERHDPGVPRDVRVGPAVEHADLLPVGVLDGESVRELDDPPRHWEAADHVLSFFAGRRGLPALGSAARPRSMSLRIASGRDGAGVCDLIHASIWARRQAATCRLLLGNPA